VPNPYKKQLNSTFGLWNTTRWWKTASILWLLKPNAEGGDVLSGFRRR